MFDVCRIDWSIGRVGREGEGEGGLGVITLDDAVGIGDFDGC